jgi:hypothetical protein
VDDPAVAVRIDGEDLTITGAGPQEVRVKPGTYTVKATKDGKPVGQEVVTVEKDGKRVVKVTYKPDAEAPAVAGRGSNAAGLRVQERIRTELPDLSPDSRALMLVAMARAIDDTGRLPAPPPDGMEHHASYPKLQALLVEAGRADVAPDRLRQVLAEARTLADQIFADWKTAHEPDSADANLNRLLEKRLAAQFPTGAAARLDLIRTAWKEARRNFKPIARKASNGPVPQTHPKYSELQALVGVAGRPGEEDRVKTVLGQAYELAGTILKETAESAALNAKSDAPKPDPAWGKVLKTLSDQYLSLRTRLAGTRGSRVVTLGGPVTNLDKATADLKEPDRGTVKRLLALRDQFALAFPKVQQAAVKVGELRGKASAKQIETLEDELRSSYATLATILGEMETLAVALGAGPTEPTTGPTWDDRLKKLTDEFQALRARLVKTRAGGVLETAGVGADPERATAGLGSADVVPAKKLLVLRDRFERLVPQFRKDIGVWEKAALAARDARQMAEAGIVSANELQAAQTEQKAAERVLTGAEQEMTGLLADLRKLADELTAPAGPAAKADNLDAEYKAVMAEYDALTLRLANTPVGRVLALLPPREGWVTEKVRQAIGQDKDKVDRAVRLLEIRDKIISQADKADRALTARHNVRVVETADETWRAEVVAMHGQEIKLRTVALRGLVDDLKKLADEIDPPPTVDVEFNKVMAEYDALVLRLAKTNGGRLLAMTQPSKWGEGDVSVAVGPDPTQVAAGKKLLWARDQVLYQSSEARQAIKDLGALRQRLAGLKEEKATVDRVAEVEAGIRKMEQEVRFRTVTLGGFVGDVREVTGLWDPPKK